MIMANLNQKIKDTIQIQDSLLCVGLDVNPQKMPAHILQHHDPIFYFNQAIIDATKDLVMAYKSNLAFYEALGTEGWDILNRTVKVIPEGILKIGDGKRGDIGSTAEQYARSLFQIGFDVVTVNPYLGIDSIRPFIQSEERGVFVLCLTSNPSSKDFQKMVFKNKSLYLHVAEKTVSWNEKQNCGLVVGATHPDELQAIRQISKSLPFLIPGIGAQGGDLEGAILAGTDEYGEMAIINSSRSILYASNGKDFAEAARKEASSLRNQINIIRKKKRKDRNGAING